MRRDLRIHQVAGIEVRSAGREIPRMDDIHAEVAAPVLTRAQGREVYRADDGNQDEQNGDVRGEPARHVLSVAASLVGQVGNLRPIGNRPLRRLATWLATAAPDTIRPQIAGKMGGLLSHESL